MRSRVPKPAQLRAAPAPRQCITFNRDLLGLCLGFFCFGYNWYLLVTWLPDYLMQVRHLSVMKAGFSAAIPFLDLCRMRALGGLDRGSPDPSRLG